MMTAEFLRDDKQLVTPNLTPVDTLSSAGFRWAAAVTLVVISFVWFSPYVKAAVDEANRPPIFNLMDSYYPLGEELTSLRNQARQTLRQLSKFSNGDDLVSGAVDIEPLLSDLSRIPNIKRLDLQQRSDLREQIDHYRRNQLDEKLIERADVSLTNHIAGMDKLFEVLDDIERLDQNLESFFRVANHQEWLHEKSAALDRLLGQISHPFSRGHESLSNEFGFVLDPPREIFTTRAEIETLLGLDSGEYLAADSATTVTERISGKVAELGGEPLTLYKWVHDNISWIPSYGLMQGADYTLQAGQGNAFDTASLLIAMLREAGFEARYRYGVAEISVEQATNWIGNVRNADAATNLMSQGGIPQTQVSYGGAVEDIRFEHVWVEFRQGGVWRSLDPSFKQYEYQEGMDLGVAVDFDVSGLLSQIQVDSTSNDSEGWVQGVDASTVESALEEYQTELESYIANTAPESTLVDVLGLQTIVSSSAVSLEDAMPAHTTDLSAAAAALPNELFHRFRFQLGTGISSDLGETFEWGGLIYELNQTTANLLGKDLAISFRPATQADEDALLSFIPQDATSAEDLPSTIPAGSINMIAELTIDGDIALSSHPVTLGTTLRSRIGFEQPQRGFSFTENSVIAGQYKAIGIDMQGVSPAQLETLEARLDSTRAAIEADNAASLSKHDVVGGVMQAGIQGYFAMTYATDRIAAQSAGVVYYRQPSYGTFSTDVQVAYGITGQPLQVSFTGVAMDVDRVVNNVEEKANCYEGFVAFNRASGMRNSAFEHQIPEQLFSTDEEQAEGVSTAKALAIAMAQGQRIYTLNANNASQLNNIIIDEGSRSEIIAALSEGLEVTVHEAPITVNGWQGSGYTILDVDYGVGAYKISGGGSGGELQAVIGALFALVGAGSQIGSILEDVAELGKAFDKVARILGPLGVFLSVVDAKISGCSRGASLGIFYASLSAWGGTLLLSFYAIPLLALIFATIAILAAQFLVTNAIKDDFCGD